MVEQRRESPDSCTESAAFDIAENEEERQRPAHFEEAENLVADCAKELCVKQTGELDSAIQSVLEKIGSFWEAGRVYLFQTEEPEAGMSHEWDAGTPSWKERIHAYMPFFQHHWNHYFISNAFVKIQDMEEVEASRPEAYQMLKELNIDSIFVLPLRAGDHLLGFLGMENYNTQKISDIFGTLNSIAAFTAYTLRISSLKRDAEKNGR